MNLFNLLLAPPTLSGPNSITTQINNTVNTGVTIFLAVLASLVALYAMYIGFKFATAKEDQARGQAKMQLIYSLIGAVSIGAIAGLIRLLHTIGGGGTISGDYGYFHGASTLVTQIGEMVAAITGLISSLAIVFAIYVAWQLMKAEDDGKRKEAKKQLLYTVIGIIVVVLVNAVVPAAIRAAAPSGGPTIGAAFMPIIGLFV